MRLVKQLANSVLKISNATLALDSKVLWSDLNLEVAAGEFIAVIGANGSGKTSLLKSILGQLKLNRGTVQFNESTHGENWHNVESGSSSVGYIPQQRTLEEANEILVKDLVRFGLSGHRYGFFLPSHKAKAKVVEALRCADAFQFADQAFGQLSGGEQQRVRVAQSIVSDPKLLLCDEPLSALDLQQQSIVSELIKREAKEHNTAVLFVTHDVNPVLDMVDRVLYLANGKFKIGTPDEVFNDKVLSELYGTKVEVLKTNGRIVVLGAGSHDHHDGEVH